MQIKVSVIVPFFNAAAYLERCVKSLLNQSLDGLELIFINDCSTDESVHVLENAIAIHARENIIIKIISQESRQGVASARNKGLDQAIGLYLGWVDADDWVEEHMFSTLYKSAVTTDAAIVWTPFFVDYEDRQLIDKQLMVENSKEYMRALIQGEIEGMLWNKIFKKSIIDSYHIRFLAGCNMGEDRNFLFKVLFYSMTIVREPNFFYHYVQSNEGAITRDPRMERVYEGIRNNEDVVRFIVANNIDYFNNRDVNSFIARGKKRLLLSTDITDFKVWESILPSTHKALWNIPFPLHYKLLGWCASKKIWFPVKLWINIKKILHRTKGGNHA